MLCESIVLTLALAVIWFAWAFYFRPKRQQQAYVRMIRQLGYKVYAYDFKFLGYPRFEEVHRDLALHKDATYSMKHQQVEYDVLVSNSLQHVSISFLNPQLFKNFLGADKVMLLHKKMAFSTLNKGIPGGVIFIDGQEWKQSKKVLSKVFNYNFMTSQIPSIVTVTDSVFTTHEEQARKGHPEDGPDQFTVNILTMSVDIAAAVVMNIFLGIQAQKELIRDQPIQHFVLKVVDTAFSLPANDPLALILGHKFVKTGLKKSYRDFERDKALMKDFLRAEICKIKAERGKRESGGPPATIVEAIIEETEKEKDGAYNQAKMVDEIATFIFAGSDTTSNFITMMLLEVYKRPQVLRRLREEIDKYIGEEEITASGLKELKYLECIQYQTNRMHGPVEAVFARMATQQVLVCDIPIQTDTALTMSMKPTFYNPKYFPDPHSFLPERWEGDNTSQMLTLIGYAFSGGPRTCIGKHIALLESKIAVVKFVRRYSAIEELHERVFALGITTNLTKPEVRLTKFPSI